MVVKMWFGVHVGGQLASCPYKLSVHMDYIELALRVHFIPDIHCL